MMWQKVYEDLRQKCFYHSDWYPNNMETNINIDDFLLSKDCGSPKLRWVLANFNQIRSYNQFSF